MGESPLLARGGQAALGLQESQGARLAKYADTPIERHTKVWETASPNDGNLLYWAQRLKAHPEVSWRVAWLLRAQGGRCAWCGLLFTTLEDIMDVDHTVPRSRGGTVVARNRQLLYGHCHDAKTARDASMSR